MGFFFRRRLLNKSKKKKIFCYDHTLNFRYYFVTWMLILLFRILKFSSFSKIKSAFNNMLKPKKLKKFLKKKRLNISA